MNADEVKVALVQALLAHGITARTELRIRGCYGIFPADVAVLNADGQLVTVAEAKMRPHDLRIRQRTNYASCGVPAFLVWRTNISDIASAMAAYILAGTIPSESLLITQRTWASNRPHNGRVQSIQGRGRIIKP